MNKILYFIVFISMNSFCFVAAAILFPAFAALTEILFRLHQFFSDFQAPFVRLKILAWFEKPGLDFQPGLNYSPCNRQFDFKIIRFRSRAEIPHVIRPQEDLFQSRAEISARLT